MAGQARELFNGSIPPALLAQIMKAVDFGAWPSVWVGCSGTFSFERAICKAHPKVPIYGNDVSLISGVIASVATGQPLDFKFDNKLAYWEDLLDGRPYIDRAAALILCMSLAGQYRGTNIHARKHWQHFEADLDGSLAKPRDRLMNMAKELRLTDYIPGDFRDHLKRAAEVGGGFIVSAPFVKGFYEGWFKFINQNVSWTEPSYNIWNPDDFPQLLDEIDGYGIPYIAVYKSPLEGRHTACYFRKGMHPPFYVLTREPPRKTSLVDQPPSINAKPFAFKPIDLDRVTDDSKVEIFPCQAGYADYVKSLYLQENITFTSAPCKFLVYVDDMLAGIMSFAKLTSNMAGGWHPRNSCYLLSDTSTTRYGRFSKLIAMLATCTDVLRHVQDRLVHRPIEQVVTTVRSNNPVSMKYRSIYNVLSRKEGDDKTNSGSAFVINYGSGPRAATPQDIFKEWRKKYYRDDRNRKVTNSYATRKEDQPAGTAQAQRADG